MDVPYPLPADRRGTALHEIAHMHLRTTRGDLAGREPVFWLGAPRVRSAGVADVETVRYSLSRYLVSYLRDAIQGGEATRSEVMSFVPAELLAYGDRLGIKIDRPRSDHPPTHGGWRIDAAPRVPASRPQRSCPCAASWPPSAR